VEPLLQVVYEDKELLVVNKPAGLVCHPTKTDEYSSLISRARLYLGTGSRPQLINRLDRETSGITCLAKDEVAARKARRLWESRQVTKEYLAIVHGAVHQPEGAVSARLGKDERSPVAIKDCVREDGAEAKTEYRRLKNFTSTVLGAESPGLASPWFSLLRVIPHTGRKHQIRIHLAHLGHPIVGDKIYGGDEDLYLALVEDRLTEQQRARLILPYHALHAARVGFCWDSADKVFEAEPEPWFKAFCSWTVEPV